MGYTFRSHGADRSWNGKRHFQHWYRDNQVYFITARCKDKYPAFTGIHAKNIFWRQFGKYTAQYGFTPFVTSLLDNHYHTVGYLKLGKNLAPMMRGIQGSVAKLVNDVLQAMHVGRELEAPVPDLPVPGERGHEGRLVPFWRDAKNKNYFDGCLRNEKQGRLTYRYVLTQCRRHGVCDNWRDYEHTRVNIEMEKAIARATQLSAFLYGVRYRRYEGDP